MKKWIAATVFIIIAVIVLVVVTSHHGSEKFDTYNRYSNDIGVRDWHVSEDTVKSFTSANCSMLAEGDMPSIKFQNENHVKSSAAAIAAYCPDSFDNFLAGVIMKYPDYKETALYINEKIHVDSP